MVAARALLEYATTNIGETKMRKKDNQCTICGRNIYPFQRTSTGCVYCDIFGTNIKGEKIKQPIIKNKNNKKLWRKKI
jgi:hypothetical protein